MEFTRDFSLLQVILADTSISFQTMALIYVKCISGSADAVIVLALNSITETLFPSSCLFTQRTSIYDCTENIICDQKSISKWF